jgi:lipopolysaccharide biosynthesis regulator YciM
MMLADWKFSRGEYGPAAELYESILALDAETHDLPEILHPLALAYRALGRPERARPLLERLRALGVDPGGLKSPR